MIEITLKAYFAQLEADELRKPAHQRRPVPSIPEMAEAIGISRVHLHRLFTGKAQNVNIKTAGKIIGEMRRRGFNMEITDLFVYREAAADVDNA